MKTLESLETIEIGMEVRFAELWDGNYDGEELLESGAVSPDGENVAAFEIVEENENILDTIVKIVDLY